MEFKDKLKKIRTEKGISQQALADAIFVSRSAVAKWENGLGYPNEASYKALAQYFGVDRTYFETEEVEEVIVEKNKYISGLKTALGAIAMILLLIVNLVLPLALTSGDYGFTSRMAAGNYADNNCISLPDYDIYWYTITSPEEYACIDGFRPVKKHFYGCTVSEEDYEYKEVYSGGEYVAILYSIKGKSGYYNILKKTGTIVAWRGDSVDVHYAAGELFLLDSLTIAGKSYEVQHNSFFITEEPVTEFSIGEKVFTVKE